MSMREEKHRRKGLGLEHWQIIALMLMIYDIIAVNFSYLGALMLRFELRYNIIPTVMLQTFYRFAPFYTIICIALFWYLRLYRSVWRFASFSELLRVIVASVITELVQIIGTTWMMRDQITFQRMPLSYHVIGSLVQFILILGIRFAYRFTILLHGRSAEALGNRKMSRIMIVGAGNAGQQLAREIRLASEIQGKVYCFIDDNTNKIGRYIDGVPVVGDRNDILLNVDKYGIDKIYVALPSATVEDRRDILNICKETGCELKNLPGTYQLVNGEVSIAAMKEVAIEDLLGREQIKVDMTEIYAFLSGKTVLITGGGGSIGSELARQVASHQPACLCLVDIYENNAYDIQQELKRQYPELNLVVLIASVRDSRRINQIFSIYKPDIVFHAAAHKHVPLMEDSPDEAIKNNVFGTYKTAYAAMMNGCKRFVLISTDKAVNPTNIMGASKRMCEMVIQSFDRKIKEGKERELPELHVHTEEEFDKESFIIPGQDNLGHRSAQTEFVAVRFGNVLGSNGSVIPLFKKQIAEGGPVTVTHPDIIRYFMTIPEAVSLVLQAGAFAAGGEIFVLDMGKSVKIDTLARNLIKLSGFKPDVDIKIVYTGLRPGEKLYEEKLMAEEGLRTTSNELIHIGMPIAFDTDQFLKDLGPLLEAAYENDRAIKGKVQEMVSTYHPAGAHGSLEKGAGYQAQTKA